MTTTTTNQGNTAMKQLVIETATGKQVVPVQGKHKVQAVKGARYRVVGKKGEEEVLADDVIATREGQDLHLTYADGAQVVVEGYYGEGSQGSAVLPGDGGGYTLTADSSGTALSASGGDDAPQLIYAHGHSDSLLKMAQSESGLNEVLSQQVKANDSDLGVWVPQSENAAAAHLGGVAPIGLALGGSVVAAGLGGGSAASTPAAPLVSTVIASVVGGLVLQNNDLLATVYAADGTELGHASINEFGIVTVQISSGYTGVVVIKVQNDSEPTNDAPDYMDEATGVGKDLGNATLYSTGTITQAGATISLNVNVLTSLAYHKAVEAAGNGSLTSTVVNDTNTAIAQAFGLDDLTGGTILTVVDQAGNAQTSNTYGVLLAALSGADQNNTIAGDTQATINSLVAGTTITGGTASLDSTVQETIVTGAATTDPSNSLHLVDSVSDATTVTSATVSFNDVAGDNIINASEQGTTLTGTNAAGATVTLSIGSNTRTATVSGTTWSYTLAAEDITAIGQGAERLVATADLGGSTAQASRGIFVDTIAPTAPTLGGSGSTNDSTPVLSGTGEPDSTITVTVGGATWSTTTRNGNWSVNTGTDAPSSGNYTPISGTTNPVTVTSTDPAGNTTTTTSNLALDTSAPTPPTLGGSGSTNDSTPVLSGTGEPDSTITVTVGGATYTTTTNSSGGWSVNAGTDTPTSGSYTAIAGATNPVTVTSTDPAGNSTTTTSHLALDTTAPTLTAVSIASNNSNTAQANVGDTVTLTFTTDGTHSGTPSVTIAGHNVVPTNTSGNSFSASYTLASGDPEGSLTFTINASDAAGNAMSQVTTATDSSTVTFDHTVPTAPTLGGTGSTNNSTPVLNGTAEPGSTISVTIGGATYTTTANSNGDWQVDTSSAAPSSGTYTPISGVTNAVVITSTDPAGNSTTSSSNIALDTTPPVISSVSLADGAYKVGDTVTITVAAANNETGLTLAGTFNGQTLTGITDNHDGTYSATYTVAQGDADVTDGSNA
ncbi:Ig-like domain-containing protein, partial [Aquabacterium sp.]|uniref:Ig-like domain-containing protein n=1 Tax=Aquabacterium sp. TaxID=1872578 RepID=UPI003D07F384